MVTMRGHRPVQDGRSLGALGVTEAPTRPCSSQLADPVREFLTGVLYRPLP